MPRKRAPLDLEDLVPSWVVHLQAARKSPSTIKSYTTGVNAYLRFCADKGIPAVLDRRTVAAFTAHLLDSGLEPATVTARQLGVRRFSAWLTEEGELDADPLLGVRAPKLDSKVIEPLSEDEIKALLATCTGKDFMARRDAALIRFMVETGSRAGETAGLQLADVDLVRGTAIIRRGKGGRGRFVPFGSQTAQAIDRYIRVRRSHRLASGPDLWLGDRGKAFSYDALHKALGARARAAGIDRFHPHLLRHTAAHRWLAAGGSEGGLMAVAGWTRPDMLLRYTRARAAERAATEARALNLGDF